MPNTLPIVLQKIVFKSFIIILTLSRATLDFSGLVWCLGLNLPQVFATSATCFRALNIYIHTTSETEFKEFEPRHWIFNNQLQLSVGSNLKTLIKVQILWITSLIWHFILKFFNLILKFLAQGFKIKLGQFSKPKNFCPICWKT